MGRHLTSDEWDRIEAFAQKPSYLRRPEHLLPEDATDDEGERTTAAASD
ncbi:hypothetical protein ACOZ4I_00290 [Haloarcula salina]